MNLWFYVILRTFFKNEMKVQIIMLEEIHEETNTQNTECKVENIYKKTENGPFQNFLVLDFVNVLCWYSKLYQIF